MVKIFCESQDLYFLNSNDQILLCIWYDKNENVIGLIQSFKNDPNYIKKNSLTQR